MIAVGRRTTMVGVVLIVVLTAFALPKFFPSGETYPEVTVRDSAGVRIVTSAEHERTAGLDVGAEPVVEIGMLEGPPEYTFRRITDATRLPDGAIVVSDVHDVRVYEPDGRHRVTFGRAGNGPGEFVRIRALVQCRGGILVGDLSRPTLALFDAAGTLLDSWRLPPTGELMPWLTESCPPDGMPLVRSPRSATAGMEAGTSRGLIRVARLDPATGALDTLLRIPAHTTDPTLPVPFAPRTVLAYGATAVHAMDTDRLEVRTYRLEGELRRIARVPKLSQPVTAEDLEREREATVRGFPKVMREQLRRDLEGAPVPDALPMVARMRADPAGRVWVQPFRVASGAADPLWIVFDPEGAYAGRVALPAGLVVHEIGRDYVLGVWQDETEGSYVRLHRLVSRP